MAKVRKKKQEDIDFGQWICPKSWDDISLGLYQEIEQYYLNTEGKVNIIDILHILCDKTKDEVNALPIVFVEKILEQIAFIQEQPIVEPSNKIVIDGEAYIVHTDKTLRFGEYVAADSVIKQENNDYATLLAILCRKEGEVYDSQFEAEKLDERVELFKKQPITKILPIVNFFLQSYLLTEGISQVYSQLREGVSQLAKSIKSSQNLGVFKKLYLNWQVKHILKLLK